MLTSTDEPTLECAVHRSLSPRPWSDQSALESQPHARENAHTSFLGLAEKQLRRTLPKDVEDDLHRLHPGIFNRLQRLFDPFHTHAVAANLALSDKVIERREQFRIVVNLSRRTV